jgi:hypothetical protein
MQTQKVVGTFRIIIFRIGLLSGRGVAPRIVTPGINYGDEKLRLGEIEKASLFSNRLTKRVANGLILFQIYCLKA